MKPDDIVTDTHGNKWRVLKISSAHVRVKVTLVRAHRDAKGYANVPLPDDFENYERTLTGWLPVDLFHAAEP